MARQMIMSNKELILVPGSMCTLVNVVKLWISVYRTLMSAINTDVRSRAVALVGKQVENEIYSAHAGCPWAYQHHIIAHKHSMSAEKGLMCHKCGEFGAFITMKQTRSADEGMTAIGNCPSCGHTWRPT